MLKRGLGKESASLPNWQRSSISERYSAIESLFGRFSCLVTSPQKIENLSDVVVQLLQDRSADFVIFEQHPGKYAVVRKPNDVALGQAYSFAKSFFYKIPDVSKIGCRFFYDAGSLHIRVRDEASRKGLNLLLTESIAKTNPEIVVDSELFSNGSS